MNDLIGTKWIHKRNSQGLHWKYQGGRNSPAIVKIKHLKKFFNKQNEDT